MQRVHWDPEFAREPGNPTTYDYGRMRETWLIHLCTDWMGDDAWLWKLDCEFRKFNYVGDTQWMRGARGRASTWPRATGPAVDLELWGENQRGEITTPGHATILLPSREHGPVRLPDPPGGATRTSEQALAAISRGVRAPMTVDGLDITFAGGVLRLHLDRPDKRNAIDDEMMAGADRRGRRRRPRRQPCASSCSAGGSTSAAAPTSWPATRPTSDGQRVGSIQRRLPAQAHRLIPLILSTQVPVVCKVRGWAAGIGFQLALAADFTIAAADARFWEPFVDRGFTPDSGATWLLPRRVGDVRAREMLMLGRVVAVQRPRAGGWCTASCPRRSSTRASARSWRSSRGSATVALGLTKWLIHRDASRRCSQHLQNEAFAMELSSRSEDFREGLAAFREKRDPDFQGR